MGLIERQGARRKAQGAGYDLCPGPENENLINYVGCRICINICCHPVKVIPVLTWDVD